MAQLMQPFDPSQYNPSQGGGGSLPIGEHLVVAKTSEVKPAKSGAGGYLQYDVEIIDGEHKGRSGAYRLNLYHSNQQTVSIANEQLTALLYACGHYQPLTDSAAIHNIPFRVVVQPQKGPEAAEKGYTEITAVKDQNGNPPRAPGQQQAPAGFGGQQQAQQQPAQQQQQAPAQQPAQQPPGSAWGQQGQQAQQPQQDAQQQQQAPAWGGGQSQQQAQQPAQQQAPAWSQQAPAQQPASGGTAPWQQ